mmetsp:Transcript_24732/g.69851  ORF Transcript_24732/g.69851 Transcript_24732/m.69851 type:complete len:275 (-) Transcript_24732:693-1517(-)
MAPDHVLVQTLNRYVLLVKTKTSHSWVLCADSGNDPPSQQGSREPWLAAGLKAIRELLEALVNLGSRRISRLGGELAHALLCLRVIQIEHEPLAQLAHDSRGAPAGLVETWQLGLVACDLHQGDKSVNVLPRLEQALDDEVVETLPVLRLLATHGIDELRRELERGALHRKVGVLDLILPGRHAHDKAKVNVGDEAGLEVQHDVPVVAVLDTQDVAHEAIASHRIGEVAANPGELLGVRVLLREELAHGAPIVVLLQAVERGGVLQELDQPARL